MTSDERRELALSLAVQWCDSLPGVHRPDVFELADRMLDWLERAQ